MPRELGIKREETEDGNEGSKVVSFGYGGSSSCIVVSNTRGLFVTATRRERERERASV